METNSTEEVRTIQFEQIPGSILVYFALILNFILTLLLCSMPKDTKIPVIFKFVSVNDTLNCFVLFVTTVLNFIICDLLDNPIICTFIGALSVISIITSEQLIFIMTVERMLMIVFPLYHKRISKNRDITFICSVFCIVHSIVFAIIPVFKDSHSYEFNYFLGSCLVLLSSSTNDYHNGFIVYLSLLILITSSSNLVIYTIIGHKLRKRKISPVITISSNLSTTNCSMVNNHSNRKKKLNNSLTLAMALGISNSILPLPIIVSFQNKCNLI